LDENGLDEVGKVRSPINEKPVRLEGISLSRLYLPAIQNASMNSIKEVFGLALTQRFRELLSQ
jgi:hypothetical protein